MVTSSDESRKHVPNYSKRTRAHGHGAAEMHSGESPGVPGTQQAAGTRAGVHPSVPALIHLPGLLGTDHRWTGFVLYFDINMCNMFCSFLAHPGMKITRLTCSGRTPPNSAWWHQCTWEDKQDLCRNGDTGYMGCLFNVLGTLTVHFFTDCPGRWFFVKAD